MKILLLSLGLGKMLSFLKPPAKIGFIATAGETYDDPYFVNADRERLRNLGYQLVELDVSKNTIERLEADLQDLDGIFVAGGNSFFLLQQFNQKEMGRLIRDFLARGGAYIGASAGAAVCGPSLRPVAPLDDPDQAPSLKSHEALGLVDLVVLPHYGKEKYMELYNGIIEEHKAEFDIVPLRDDQAIVMLDRKNYEVVDSELILHDASG